jgi:Rrf2 family protein
MRMSDGVEWSIHCCTLLATLPTGEALPAARLAEFHDVPPAYLAKHLQALVGSGIATSLVGPRGGYALARPATDISLLDIVLAVDGEETAFRCSQIRQRGPAAQAGSAAYRRPCGIARAMWRAEDAWRAELGATSVSDILTELMATVPADQVLAGAEWIQSVQINRWKHP